MLNLVGVSQYIDEDGDVDKYRAQIEKCVQSFRFT
jgi:hypothetical protein